MQYISFIFRLAILTRSLVIFFTCIACQPSSMEEFREEGEGIIHSLVGEMKHIHNLTQLDEKKHSLKALFNALIEVSIAAHEYQARHPEAKQLHHTDNPSSDLLREEINRLCYIDGGKALLEKIQEDSLHRLDAYLKRTKAK